MNRLTWYLGAVVLLGHLEYSLAGQVCDGSLGRELQCTRCATMPCCCPDDYCRKPFPCIPCLVLPRTPDCYCPKPMPCVPCLGLSWCPDDYCPKPLPCSCWPVANRQFYRCPPGTDGCRPPACR